jgi:hypothetical protein
MKLFLKGEERKGKETGDLCKIGAIWKRLMDRKSYLENLNLEKERNLQNIFCIRK